MEPKNQDEDYPMKFELGIANQRKASKTNERNKLWPKPLDKGTLIHEKQKFQVSLRQKKKKVSYYKSVSSLCKT